MINEIFFDVCILIFFYNQYYRWIDMRSLLSTSNGAVCKPDLQKLCLATELSHYLQPTVILCNM